MLRHVPPIQDQDSRDDFPESRFDEILLEARSGAMATGRIKERRTATRTGM